MRHRLAEIDSGSATLEHNLPGQRAFDFYSRKWFSLNTNTRRHTDSMVLERHLSSFVIVISSSQICPQALFPSPSRNRSSCLFQYEPSS